MLNTLREKPLITALFLIVLYAAGLVVPSFFIDIDPNQHGIDSINAAIGEWKYQLITVTVLIAIVSILGWWSDIGFRPINKGGIKFLLPPFLYALLLLFASASSSNIDMAWFLGFVSPAQLISFTLVMLAVGFTEETVFRGILYHGIETRVTPLMTLLISAGIFGIFHYVNLLLNAPFDTTTYQVLHAMAAGFMYASLRLRIAAIWPVMLFHGFWDFTIFMSQNLLPNIEDAAVTSSFSLTKALSMMLLPTLYGAFVYWRWSKGKKGYIKS